jgi:hypothetical protein
MKFLTWLFFFLCSFYTLQSYALDPITVSTLAQLSFGKLAAGSGGTVVMATSGSRTKTGGVVLLSTGPGSTAIFRLQGTPSQAFIVTLPGNTTVNMSSGAESVRVTDFTVSPGSTGTFNGVGTQNLTIGATMNVDSNKVPGDYSGTFSITIDYQ